jgi:hypothetical protein
VDFPRPAVHPARRRAIGRGKAAIVTLAVGVVGAVVLYAPSADAAADSFGASAVATGMKFSFSNDSLPVVQTYEVSAPTSSATLNSVGNSQSFASAPYPGDVIQNLPSVAGALVPVPFPAYPLYVSAVPGDDPKSVSYPGIGLRAEAGATVVQASGTFGSDGAGGLSSARAEVLGDGTVRSLGSAAYKALDLGPQVRVDGVHSTAQVVADAQGKLTRSQSLSIDRLQIPGLAITIPQGSPSLVPIPNPIPGIPQAPPLELTPIPYALVGGQTLSQPDIGFVDGYFTISFPFIDNQRYALPTSAMADALKAAGVRMAFQQAQETKNGVIAPALTISYDVPAPPENPYYSGAGTATYVLGGVAASAALSPEGASDAATAGGVSNAPAAGPGLGAAGGTADLASAGGASLPSLGVIPGAAGAAGGVTGIDTAAQPTSVALMRGERALYRGPLTEDASAIYLLVVVIAGMASIFTVVRLAGVRGK